MRVVVQRVSRASVSVEGEVVGRCGQGFCLLVGAAKGDSAETVRKVADRVAGLRIFNDENGKMNLSLSQLEESDASQILAISNFTVGGDVWASRRPSFMTAAPYDEGKELFDLFVDTLREAGLTVETGEFGAHMDVEIVNDGPVTMVVDL